LKAIEILQKELLIMRDLPSLAKRHDELTRAINNGYMKIVVTTKLNEGKPGNEFILEGTENVGVLQTKIFPE